jgi:hypothetical protein
MIVYTYLFILLFTVIAIDLKYELREDTSRLSPYELCILNHSTTTISNNPHSSCASEKKSTNKILQIPPGCYVTDYSWDRGSFQHTSLITTFKGKLFPTQPHSTNTSNNLPWKLSCITRNLYERRGLLNSWVLPRSNKTTDINYYYGYTSELLSTMHQYHIDTIYFIGDSMTRQIFFYFKCDVEREISKNKLITNITVVIYPTNTSSVNITFVLLPKPDYRLIYHDALINKHGYQMIVDHYTTYFHTYISNTTSNTSLILFDAGSTRLNGKC